MTHEKVMAWRDEKDQLAQRVGELEKTLQLARQAAEVERQRADAAEESARRAWRLSPELVNRVTRAPRA